MINEADSLPRHQVNIAGRNVSFVESGAGSPIIFLHGNVTYSYTWRNVIPYLSYEYRCIAPDRVGMGNSELQVPSGTGSYRFEDYLQDLELFVEIVEPRQPVVLVSHELGSALAIQYARKNPQHVAGLVLIEGAFRLTNDLIFDEDVRDLLADVRTERGEDLVLKDNKMIEFYLPRLTMRALTALEMDHYRRPYLKPGESRRALLSLARQLPLQSSPGPIDHLVEESRLWCAQSRIPKLVVGGRPGFLVPAAVMGSATRWASTDVESVPGLHFLMEDSPARLTTLILDWLSGLGQKR